jgi:two-component system sensor histidine kinase KdpD
VASAGEQPPEGPGADLELPVSQTMTLACRGQVPARTDMRVLHSCAVQIVAGLDGWPRHEQEAEATRHAADLRSRMTLLAATGKNAREHLEEARTTLTALADRGLAVTPQDRAALADARHAVDYVSRLIDDLRDLSRLHAGAVETYLRPVDLDEVVADALDDLGPGRQHVTLSTAEDLPDVIVDAALLTRILTSLLADAWQRCPAGPMPALAAVALDRQVEIRISDQGPDQDDGTASLALRLARDLAEAMGDTLRCERAPGGGRTVIVTLPASARRSAVGSAGPAGGREVVPDSLMPLTGLAA